MFLLICYMFGARASVCATCKHCHIFYLHNKNKSQIVDSVIITNALFGTNKWNNWQFVIVWNIQWSCPIMKSSIFWWMKSSSSAVEMWWILSCGNDSEDCPPESLWANEQTGLPQVTALSYTYLMCEFSHYHLRLTVCHSLSFKGACQLLMLKLQRLSCGYGMVCVCEADDDEL